MRIGIDVRYLSHGLLGGIHTYLSHFIPALSEEARDHQVVLYADTKRPFELNSLPSNVNLRLLPYRNPLSSVFLDFWMWRWMVLDRMELAHFPANYGFAPRSLPAVITLADEINLLPWSEIYRGHQKKVRTIAMMTYLHVCTRLAMSRVKEVITVSEYARRRILAHSRLSPNRIVVIPHACPDDIFQVTDGQKIAQACDRMGIQRPFVLADAFKNPEVLVRAWRRLPVRLRRENEIVFFARSPDVLPVIHEAVAEGSAKLLVRPERADLRVLYSACRVFVFPSWIEGFGLPLLEAMTCGAPVVASNRGSIPEVLSGAGWIVDPEDAVALSDCLVRLIEEPDQRLELQRLGFSRAGEFSWSDSARRTLQVYSDLVEGMPERPRTPRG